MINLVKPWKNLTITRVLVLNNDKSTDLQDVLEIIDCK